MIALIAFACGRSDRHFRTPAPNTPGNNNKPGYQDDGSSGGMLISTEGSLATGKPIKVQTNLTIPGATALSVNVDKGYYNIRTSYDTGLVQWVLKDGDKDLAKLNTDDNPAASFDIYFATAKNYQFELVFTGTETCSLTIEFEPSYGPYWPDKFIMDLNKNYSSITYPHVFRNQSPEPGGYFLGDWGYGGTFPEVKTSLIFTRSEYGEYRKDHVLSVYEVNVQGLDYTESSNLTQRAAPEDHIWDFQVGIDPAQQFDTGGFINIIVRLKDEDEHIYDCRWEFRWHPRLPIATACSGAFNDNDDLLAIAFFTDRVFEPEDREIMSNSITTVNIGGQQFNINNLAIQLDAASQYYIELPQPIPYNLIPNLATMPFSIEVNAIQDIKEKYHLSSVALLLAHPNFWNDEPFKDYKAISSYSHRRTLNDILSDNYDCGCGSNSNQRVVSKNIPQEDMCVDCEELPPGEPVTPNVGQIGADRKPKPPKPGDYCCTPKFQRFYDRYQQPIDCFHTAITCLDSHFIRLKPCKENDCLIDFVKPKIETCFLSEFSSLNNAENFRIYEGTLDQNELDQKMCKAEEIVEKSVLNFDPTSGVYSTFFSHYSNVSEGKIQYFTYYVDEYGKKQKKECDNTEIKFFGDREPPKVEARVVFPDTYANYGIEPENQCPTGATKTKYFNGNDKLIGSYISNGCGAFLRIQYSDNQCVWDSWKYEQNDSTENGRLVFYIRPNKEDLNSLGATQAQQEMMWQPITLSWIWTHKTNTDQYVDWYIVNHDYHEPQDGTDEWSVIPYSWLKTSQAAQYQKDFLPPARNVPPGTNYWKGFEIKTVCRDDFSPLEKRFCNFGVAYSEVPIFTWTEGEKVGLWHLKNRHHDPEFKPPTIEFHPETNGAPEDPFSTFAAIPGGWAHFINAKAHSDRTIPDKNKYVQFTMLHTLNRNHYKTPIKFFYTDPNQHHEQWNDEPTQPKIAELDTNSDPKDDNERRKGVGADDNYGDPGGFYASAFNYGAKEMEKTPSELPSGSRISFNTNRYGGDNFIPKAYYITPACFQWGRLGKPDTDESVTVWRKYPVRSDTLSSPTLPAFSYKDIEKGVKGAFDDGFAYVCLWKETVFQTQNRYISKNEVEGTAGWAVDISDNYLDFHSRNQADDICHNPHVIFWPYDWTPNPPMLAGGVTFAPDWPVNHTVSVINYKGFVRKYHKSELKRKLQLRQTTIHELNHMISHVNDFHNWWRPNECVMTFNTKANYQYYTENGVTKLSIPYFCKECLTDIRSGNTGGNLSKYIGFFNRRSQP